MTSHAILQAFRTSKPAFGAWITMPGALNARVAAQASPHLSWIMIDCEHGLTPLNPAVGESIQAIAGFGPAAPSALVRIPGTGTCSSTSWQIKYVLDSGARGVLVPMVGRGCLAVLRVSLWLIRFSPAVQVSTPEKAREIVSDCRFPPAGRRGYGNPFTHLAWGVSAADYLASANEHVAIIIQIENREGVDNLEQIAAVDGLGWSFWPCV
ncbi:hypothetical protein ID866_8847 [Astraeus odoratus]|nr:hypothetical protein ID866_8847 [Astraeus odoratus]